MDSFELFHIESEQNMIAAVDEFIERQKSGSAVSNMKSNSLLSDGMVVIWGEKEENRDE